MAGPSEFVTRVCEAEIKRALVERKGVGDDVDRKPFYYRQMDGRCRGGGQGSVEGDQVSKGEVLHNNKPCIYWKAQELLHHRHLFWQWS